MLDETDRRILRHLQQNPGQSTSALASSARVPASTILRRLDRLREQGVLRGQRAVINWRALGYAVEVSLRITLDKTQRDAFDSFLAKARQIPEVFEIQTFLGRVDVRLNVLARDMPHYTELYRDRILALPHIAEIEALMLVSTLQDHRSLPL